MLLLLLRLKNVKRENVDTVINKRCHCDAPMHRQCVEATHWTCTPSQCERLSSHSVNGDIAIQWEWSNFDPSWNPNPL